MQNIKNFNLKKEVISLKKLYKYTSQIYHNYSDYNNDRVKSGIILLPNRKYDAF